jgi:putative mycofactocin binding protein MftB
VVTLESELQLHPQVALRPEPFGALAYHYGTRRLVFLKHPDMVKVVRALDGSHTLGAVLSACEVAPQRWESFVQAIGQLESSEIVVASSTTR